MDFLIGFFLFFGGSVVFQLFRIQIFHHSLYTVRAVSQYANSEIIPAKRGELFWQDISAGERLPLAINRPLYTLYAVPKNIVQKDSFIKVLGDTAIGGTIEALQKKLTKPDDSYEQIATRVEEKEKDALTLAFQKVNIKRDQYGFEENPERFYLEGALMGQVTGFLGFEEDGKTRRGQYGIEEYLDVDLQGKEGAIVGETDAYGRPITIGKRITTPVQNGRDVLLTIDKNIQYKACTGLKEYIDKFQAESGAVVIMDPTTGGIYALCGEPNFNPNNYGKEDPRTFVNPNTAIAYEPGSIFKAITMSGAIDAYALDPWTTYTDTGSVTIDKFTIRNAGGKSYGVRTMIEVLDKSLNTGAIFAMRSMGAQVFKSYVEGFGFGKLTGIELAGEEDGNISSLDKSGEIYPATASFGQGITATPIQLVTAYAAIARGGIIVKPHIIASMITDTGENAVPIQEGERVIAPETAQTITAMLVSVVKNGFSKKAGVKGYSIAGKSGTAQIPNTNSPGYSDETIHSFIGFGPIDENGPVFVMLVKLDKPKGLPFASDTAALLFSDIARFILNYFEIPPEN